MIRLKNNYHTHTSYCGHASGSVNDYVQEALKKKMKVLGFSEHGHIPISSFTHVNNRFVTEYITDCKIAKDKYKDKIKIYCGLEMDYFPELNTYYQKLLKQYDYLTLSVHFLKITNGPKTHYYSAYGLETKDELLLFNDIIIKGLESKLFTFVNHPDNFLSKWDELTIKITKNIIEKALKYDIPLELNCNQFFRKNNLFWKGEVRYMFWLMVGQSKAKVIINTDCHQVKDLHPKRLSEVFAFAKALNLNLINEVKITNDY